MKTPLFLSLVLGSGMLLVFTGCNPTKSDSSTVAPPISEAESSSHDHMDADHDSDSAGKSDMEKMAETMANFPEEVRQSAMKQHFCPVSGEMLGTMGNLKKSKWTVKASGYAAMDAKINCSLTLKSTLPS